MAKFEKGSAEAKAWGEKMKKAKEAKGAGVGKSKVAPKKVTPKKVETTPVPAPPARKQQKVVLPVLGPNGELPKMNAKQRGAYDVIFPDLMQFDIEDLNESLAAEQEKSKTPEVRGWHDPDIGMYIAILKALYEKSNMSGGAIPPRPPSRIVNPGPDPGPTPIRRLIMTLTARAAEIEDRYNSLEQNNNVNAETTQEIISDLQRIRNMAVNLNAEQLRVAVDELLSHIQERITAVTSGGKIKKLIRGKGKDSDEIVKINRPPTQPFPNVDAARQQAERILLHADLIVRNYYNLEWGRPDGPSQDDMIRITDVLLTQLRHMAYALRQMNYEEAAETIDEQIEGIENDWESDTESDVNGGKIMGYGITGGRLLPIYDLKGGKIKDPFKKLNKSMWKMQDSSRKLNPFHYKDVREKGVEAGDVTNNQLLPAVVEAGMPLLYATAGTAGMMLGGPVGSAAAVKGTQMLYDEMVAKKGYDPRERQQSAVLGAVSKEAGKQGASQLKSKASSASLTQRIAASKKAEATGSGMRTMLRGKPVILIEGKGPGLSKQQVKVAVDINKMLEKETKVKKFAKRVEEGLVNSTEWNETWDTFTDKEKKEYTKLRKSMK